MNGEETERGGIPTQQRRWPKDLLRATLFCVAIVLIALGLTYWLRGDECYNSLHVGMSYGEADAILERHGYKDIGGSGNHLQFVVVFSRHKAEPPIVLIFDSDGILIAKERDSVPEYMLQSLSDRIRGYD